MRLPFKKGKIIYFGAAGCGNAYCKNSGVTPDIFVDNDQDKWGTFFNGVEVQNPDPDFGDPDPDPDFGDPESRSEARCQVGVRSKRNCMLRKLM